MTTEKETTAEETTESVFVPNIPNLKVTRNEIELEYQESELKKGPNKGWKYPAVKVTRDNLQAVMGYMGFDKMITKVQNIFNQLAQGWWEEALKDAKDRVTGLIDFDKAQEAFTKLAVDFSSRGENIADITKRIEELVDEMTELDPESDTWAEDFKSRTSEIKELKKALEDKRRPRKNTSSDSSEA